MYTQYHIHYTVVKTYFPTLIRRLIFQCYNILGHSNAEGGYDPNHGPQ